MIDRIRQFFIGKKEEPSKTTEEKIEELFNQTFSVDIIRLEIGSDIAEFGDDICAEIAKFRDKIAETYGFIFPPVHVIQNNDFQENEIKLFIREKEVLNDFWIPNLENITKEMNKNLEWIYKEFIDEIFSNEFFEKIINKVQIDNAWLIWNISCQYTVADMKKVFLNILKQKKSIKNAKYIFEKIGELETSVSSDTLSKIIIEEIS